MLKDRMSRRILLYEMLGFAIVIIALWVNELFDLPSRVFGQPSTPVNLIESVWETVFIVVLAAVIAALTLHLLKKIRLLEGFLPVCSACKKIRMDDQWFQIESYIRDHSEAEFTHTVCPECARKLYGEGFAAKYCDKK